MDDLPPKFATVNHGTLAIQNSPLGFPKKKSTNNCKYKYLHACLLVCGRSKDCTVNQLYLQNWISITILSSKSWITEAVLIYTVAMTSTMVHTCRSNVNVTYCPLCVCMFLVEPEPNSSVVYHTTEHSDIYLQTFSIKKKYFEMTTPLGQVRNKALRLYATKSFKSFNIPMVKMLFITGYQWADVTMKNILLTRK